MADLTPRMSAKEYLEYMRGHGLKSPAHRKSTGGALNNGGVTKPNLNKYNAQRTSIDGQTFDSKKEARTYQMLELAKAAADPFERVEKIVRSKRFLLIEKQDGERACTYVADFVVQYADGHIDVIDTKSEITRKNPLYVVKRKLMLERFSIRIREM